MDIIFKWNIKKLADALKISEEDVRIYFTDGRRISFILERRIAIELLNGRIADSEGAAFDIFDSEDKKWEVRSLSRYGVYFCPSYMVGSGRHFEEKGFLEKVSEIEGYFVCDIDLFPEVPIWKITSNQVIKWWREKKLGSTTNISRNKGLGLLKALDESKSIPD